MFVRHALENISTIWNFEFVVELDCFHPTVYMWQILLN